MREKLKSTVYGILGTLAEMKEGDFAPAGHIYAALGMDMQLWELARNVLVNGQFAHLEGDLLILTPKGRELGEAINKALAKA